MNIQTQNKISKHEEDVYWLLNKLWELGWKGFNEDEMNRAISVRDKYPSQGKGQSAGVSGAIKEIDVIAMLQPEYFTEWYLQNRGRLLSAYGISDFLKPSQSKGESDAIEEAKRLLKIAYDNNKHDMGFDLDYQTWLDSLSQSGQSAEPSDAVACNGNVGGKEYQNQLTKKLGTFTEYQYTGPKCVAGCKRFTAYETKHHPDCPYYPNSLSEKYDRLNSLSQSTEPVQDVEEAVPTDKDIDIWDAAVGYCNSKKLSGNIFQIAHEAFMTGWQQSQPKEDAGENQDELWKIFESYYTDINKDKTSFEERVKLRTELKNKYTITKNK